MFSTEIFARDLVSCDQVVDHETTVREIVDWFKNQTQHDYIAVFDGTAIVGLVGRDQLNDKLAGQYGFSMLADKPVTRVMLPDPLTVDGGCSLLDLTKRLLQARQANSDFYVDILVHENGEFLGLVPIKQLLVSQMQQIVQQMNTLQKQADILAQRNRELAEATIRLGQEAADFTSFVEDTSIPMMVLHADGSYAKANMRFLRLTGFPDAKTPLGLSCSQLLRGGTTTLDACLEAESSAIGDPQMTHRLILLGADQQEIHAEVSVDRDRSGKHWVLGVVRVAGDEEKELQRVLRERLQGRGQLANAFAERLIDREADADSLMDRLEHVLALADQMEKGSISLPGSGITTSGASFLQGDLQTFNMVDLLQLFVQAAKTGQLFVESEMHGRGNIFIRQGRFIHAESIVQPTGAQFDGRDALQSLLKFKDGHFQFIEEVEPPEETIQGEPMGILMRCCAAIDEEEIAAA